MHWPENVLKEPASSISLQSFALCILNSKNIQFWIINSLIETPIFITLDTLRFSSAKNSILKIKLTYVFRELRKIIEDGFSKVKIFTI